MPRKGRKRTASTKTGRVTKASNRDSQEEESKDLPQKNGSPAVEIQVTPPEDGTSSSEEKKSQSDPNRVAELEHELQRSEHSKRVLYKALIRERSLNNEKPSVLATAASKSGHNFCKPFSGLSASQQTQRIRLLVDVISEFADPKGNSTDKNLEIKSVVEQLTTYLKKFPSGVE